MADGVVGFDVSRAVVREVRADVPPDAVANLLRRVRDTRCGFLIQSEVDWLAGCEAGRLVPLLVRCGRCRFVCPAQDVGFLIRAIVLAGDYARDVSLPAEGS